MSALVVRRAKRTFSTQHYIFLCGLSGSPTLFRKRSDIRKLEHKLGVFDFLYNFSLKNVTF